MTRKEPRPAPGGQYDEPTGHVQEHVVDDIGDELDPENTDFYVCGVSDTVVGAGESIENAGVPEDGVYTEGRAEDSNESRTGSAVGSRDGPPLSSGRDRCRAAPPARPTAGR